LTLMSSLALSKAMSLRPAKSLYITDLPPMIELMKHNIQLNYPDGSDQAATEVIPLVCCWGDDPPEPLAALGHPDIVLAADCVYFEPAFPLLLKTLIELIGPETVCWFCFKRRRRADMGFARDLKKHFQVLEVGVDDGTEEQVRESETWRREKIHLYATSDVFNASAC
jgi:protein N-lysine methyltransferase METTL21A